jgi:hypothetical protein
MSKRGYLVAVGVLVAAAAILLFLFRVSEEQVIVNRMVDFEQSAPNSQIVWKDQQSVRAFEHAFRFGKKLAGKVDIAVPHYSVTLGKQVYLLWLSDESERGNFMKVEDYRAGTLYTIRESSTKKLQALLKQAYPEGSSRSAGESADERNIDLSVLEDEKGLTPPPSISTSPSAGEQPSPPLASATPVNVPPSPIVEAFTPAYLDVSSFTEEEQPLIGLINLRIQYMHKGSWDKMLDLYTENARKAREGSGSYTGFTITSISVEEDITIKEQRSLFEAVVQVDAARNNGDAGRMLYVFQKGKEKGAEWRIADVD